MSSTHNPGRVAGLLYLSLLSAPLRLIYIPNTLFVTGNATATANNIAAHELLFRLGIVGDLSHPDHGYLPHPGSVPAARGSGPGPRSTDGDLWGV